MGRKKGKKKSDSDSDSSSSVSEELKRKVLKKLKKLKKRERKKKRKREKHEHKGVKEGKKLKDEKLSTSSASAVSLNDGKSRSFAPMTKEEWEKQQNMLRRVYDEETGRMRLVRGSGEIVEECVSRDRQLQINKQATRHDGEYFQRILLANQK